MTPLVLGSLASDSPSSLVLHDKKDKEMFLSRGKNVRGVLCLLFVSDPVSVVSSLTTFV